ncbi:MAG: hypothetical protein II890_06270 [Spirochaetia bacterium]|nr:hypothetical protein [Spirochaetia bacterium]
MFIINSGYFTEKGITGQEPITGPKDNISLPAVPIFGRRVPMQTSPCHPELVSG